MKHKRSFIFGCFLFCIMLAISLFSRISTREPTVSSQLFICATDGTMQEILPIELEGEDLDFCYNLAKNLETLSWVDSAFVSKEPSDSLPIYRVMVVYENNNGSWYEDLLSSLHQYAKNISINDVVTYEKLIELTIMVG